MALDYSCVHICNTLKAVTFNLGSQDVVVNMRFKSKNRQLAYTKPLLTDQEVEWSIPVFFPWGA